MEVVIAEEYDVENQEDSELINMIKNFANVAIMSNVTSLNNVTNIEFTNIAPHDVAVAMWDEDDNLIDPGAQLTWKIQEDQQSVSSLTHRTHILCHRC